MKNSKRNAQWPQRHTKWTNTDRNHPEIDAKPVQRDEK